MRPWKDGTSLLRGRLHGRLLIVLGAVAAVAVLIAVWQFSTSIGGDEDQAVPDWTGPGPLTVDAPASPSEDPTTEAPASASPTPEASTGAPTTAAASESASEERSEEPEAEPAGPSCTAALRIDGQGEDSISVKVDVVNTGDAVIEGWEIVLDLEGVEITGTWGMSHVEGDRYGNGMFNGTLDPGEDTVPDFWGEIEGEPDLPDTVPCAATAA